MLCGDVRMQYAYTDNRPVEYQSKSLPFFSQFCEHRANTTVNRHPSPFSSSIFSLPSLSSYPTSSSCLSLRILINPLIKQSPAAEPVSVRGRRTVAAPRVKRIIRRQQTGN